MARIARVVVPNYPHHITQRGSRRQQTFFCVKDYQLYIDLLGRFANKFSVKIWAYCLMPNHVHLVAVPCDKTGLASCLSLTHRSYAMQINERHKWTGHLWQERFQSFVMDEPHLLAAVRYTELNPVRANLCAKPSGWKWSSAVAHLVGIDDGLVDVKPMLSRIGNWEEFLAMGETPVGDDAIRKHTKTGRPAGKRKFISELERLTGRKLQKTKPGPKGK